MKNPREGVFRLSLHAERNHFAGVDETEMRFEAAHISALLPAYPAYHVSGGGTYRRKFPDYFLFTNPEPVPGKAITTLRAIVHSSIFFVLDLCSYKDSILFAICQARCLRCCELVLILLL